MQEVSTVPATERDAPLDIILTENGAIAIKA
jgi:5-formyltetrahydrofolate cyclo-ligase